MLAFIDIKGIKTNSKCWHLLGLRHKVVKCIHLFLHSKYEIMT